MSGTDTETAELEVKDAQVPAEEPKPAPEAEAKPEPEVEAGGDDKPSADGGDEKPKPHWKDKVISRLSGERAWERQERLKAEERASSLEKELARLRGGSEGEAEPEAKRTPSGLSERDIQELVDKRADQKAAERAFNEACNRTYEAGKTAFSDFDEAVSTLNTATGGQIPRAFVDVVTELPNGHEVYRELGLDPDRALRVMAMSPTRMALELGKMSAALSAPKPSKLASRAPAPITPISGGARGEPDQDKMSDTEWRAWREKTKKVPF